jgi:hypothetical protein
MKLNTWSLVAVSFLAGCAGMNQNAAQASYANAPEQGDLVACDSSKDQRGCF